MSFKKQLLDPLGTVCKLIALNFCEIKTKISVQDHILLLQCPNKYQFALRYYNGDDRENISELFYVIIRVIRWYLVPKNNDHESPESDASNCGTSDNYLSLQDSDDIKIIIMYLCDGLRKLQETYEFGNVVLAIQFYINLLEDALRGEFDNSKLPKYILDKELEYKNLINYDKLKNFWDINKLRRIRELYDQCYDVRKNNEMTKEISGLIDSYLQSVYSLLEISDKDFQMLIQNSNKG